LNFNPDCYIEGFFPRMIGSGSIKRSMKRSSASNAHSDEQQDPIEDNQ